MKNLLILGVSGSIGTQTVDVVEEHPDEFKIVACSIYHNKEYLRELLKRHDIPYVGIHSKDEELENEFPNTQFFYGEKGLCELAKLEDYDLMVNALVGINGLLPTLSGLLAGKDIALANKETLVIGGDLVMALAKKNHCHIYPIDSEHSAIFQCLNGEDKKTLRRLIITASGGAFRHLSHDELKNVTLDEALHHPTWKMGRKVTIDSATMMNKGFEVIEAHYLFDVDYDHIDVLQHAESIIHSMVEFNDRSTMAQMANPDMRIAIQYALTYPKRESNDHVQSLDLASVAALHFANLSYERYPLLALAYEVGRKGGNMGAVLNAADEVAIELFIEGKIAFIDIEKLIIHAVRNAEYIPDAGLNERFLSDQKTRKYLWDKWEGLI